MADDYLDPFVTIEEACEWVSKRLGGQWTLARLLQAQRRPWVWVDYEPGWPEEIFEGRVEGFRMEMDPTDIKRLQSHGQAFITVVRLPDDGSGNSRIMIRSPKVGEERPTPIPLDELRFSGAALSNLVKLKAPKKIPSSTAAAEMGRKGGQRAQAESTAMEAEVRAWCEAQDLASVLSLNKLADAAVRARLNTAPIATVRRWMSEWVKEWRASGRWQR